MKRYIWAVKVTATVSPTAIPSRSAPKMTAKASYMKTRRLWSFVRPMARSTPNSHRFSLMLAVVEINSKKNARVSAMKPTIPTKIWKRSKFALTESCKSLRSRSRVRSSLKKALIPFVMKARRSSEMDSLRLMKTYSLGRLSVKLYPSKTSLKRFCAP